MKQSSGVKRIIMHGGILAFAGIFVRIIGLVYRIPMLNIIGSEAYGVYSAAYNVYNIMLVLSSYGLPMAVSKLVSNRLAKKHYRDAKKIFISSLMIATCTGGIAACITFFGSDFIEKNFYSSYEGIALPLRVLAPTIFIVSMLGVLRGFYQGCGTTIPTAISQLLEQIVNAIVSIAAGYILVKSCTNSAKLAGYGAAGGTMGTAFGAFSALVILVLLYLIYRPVFNKKCDRDLYSVGEDYKSIIVIIVSTMIPIILSQTFYQISAMIDDILFGNIMAGIGETSKNITRAIGNYNSSYVILTGVVMGVASSMSASMLPSIVASKALEEYDEINDKIAATIKVNMMIAIPSFLGLFSLGQPIVQLLFARYNSVEGGMMLKIGGIAVVFYTISTVTSSALQGIDKMSLPVINACISLVVHIILVVCLLRFTPLGIYAIVIGNASFPILIMILNLIALNKYIGYEQEIVKTFLIPLLCALIMFVCVILTYNFFIGLTGINIVALFFAGVVAAITYFLPLLWCKNKGLY